MKRIKKAARRSMQKAGLFAGATMVTTAGVYTGMKRNCEAKDLLCEFFVEMGEQALPGRPTKVWHALAALTSVSHAIGHLARQGWDLRDTKDVMSDFNNIMRKTSANVV